MEDHGLNPDAAKLEAAARNWFATLLVNARHGCVWAAENLRSTADLQAYREDGFRHGRIASSCHHWRWVFGDSSSHVLPFTLACEELGLCEHLIRRRIMAQCKPNKDINRLVSEVIANCG
jgi:hypothetical protein